MQRHRLLIAGLTLGAAATPLAAQSTGNVELGAFGQFTRADGAWQVDNGFGFGGRLGVFLHPRWELEADASASTFSNKASRGSGNSDQQTYAARLMYNLPFGMGGRTHQFLLGAGVGGQRFNKHSDFSVSPDVGFRFKLADAVALRFDGVLEYVENPTAATFGFPVVPGVNSLAARSTNVEIRAGLSFLLGHHKSEPPVVAAAPQQAAPEPRREPPAPKREIPPDRSGIIRDSLAAVDRARDAVLAKVYFDFDRSELKDDQRAILDAKVPVLRANAEVRIRVEGNADERGSDEYNMALGMRRAEAARKYLVDHGIDAARIDISSNGEEKAVCQGHDESCWSQNRRDEFVIVAGDATLIAPK
jgi:Outer membrane protein and related peptidoglycan-associated (lipo)proteins